jgi:hypothetical protein
LLYTDHAREQVLTWPSVRFWLVRFSNREMIWSFQTVAYESTLFYKVDGIYCFVRTDVLNDIFTKTLITYRLL